MIDHTLAQTQKAATFTPVHRGVLQRRCACENHASGGECAECAQKKGLLQRKASGDLEDTEVPPIVHEVLRSPGQPLDAVTLAFMEPRFGHDFSKVRMHTDVRAAESARAVDALAYTVGRDVVFGAGQYAPGTSNGKRLLIHELAHVVQQGYTTSESGSLLRDSNERLEQTAGRATNVVTQRNETSLQLNAQLGFAAFGILQRQTDQAKSSDDAPRVWYMLGVPPAIQQPGLTCWAAALSSWLSAMKAETISVRDMILQYVGTGCIDPNNSLYNTTVREVSLEWGVEFAEFTTPGSVTYDLLKTMLQMHGHLILAENISSSMGHAQVIYGVGIDDKRQPNRDYMSVMDPLSGAHLNRPITRLSYTLAIGRVGKRTRPAPCRKQPAEVAPP